MTRPPTSSDVALAAGVSQSAVSRAFTPGASVAPATRARVLRAAEVLGYRPNRLARSLITRRSRLIGVVVAYLHNQFYPLALELLSRALQARGHHALVFMASTEELADIDRVLDDILDQQVDGLVMASVALSAGIAARCDAAGVPVILFNRAQDDAALWSVTSDNVEGARQVARLFAASGRLRPALLAGWPGASTARDREAGFGKGLAEAGIALHGREVGDYAQDRARAATLRLFDRPDRPDALFVANDHMAFAAMDALRFELGLRIPDDVCVVGFDDTPVAAWPAYALTTVRQNADLMVNETVRLLLARLEGETTGPRRVVTPAPLVLRGSARIPQGWT